VTPSRGDGLRVRSTASRPHALIAPSALINIYRRRLRIQAVPELLAGLGVAIAVALVLATLIANSSVAGSTSEVIHTVVGPANLQLRAQGPEGFEERTLSRVEALPGVSRAAPLLEATGTITGPHGRRVTVTLVGTDISLAILDGLAHTLPISTLAPSSLGMSDATARLLGIRTAPRQAREVPIRLDLRGTANQLKVATVLGPEAVGPISQAFAAVLSLQELQRVARLKGRVSRIFVQTKPGEEASVKRELQALVAGRITVAGSDQDLALLGQALRPGEQASALFAVIAILLGFLFAFNALLLTVPERRKAIADFRLGGARRSVIVEMVLFQALLLGLAASLVGALVGYLLAITVFQQTPGYLAQAFTLSSGTTIGAAVPLVAVGGGVLATCLASAVPLLDLRPGRSLDAVYFEEAEPGNRLGSRMRFRLVVAAVILLVLATCLFVLRPSLALLATALLALASVLAVPVIFDALLSAAAALVARFENLTSLSVALRALRTAALRSLALVATGTLALFGAVALGGARGDLLRGIEGYIHGFVGSPSIWVLNPRDPTAVDPLPVQYTTRLAHLPGVANVRVFQDGYLDLGNRRVWILARPVGTTRELLQNQVVDGNTATAATRIEDGRWVALSSQLASERHVTVGDTVTLPTPTGDTAFRVAAITTNLTWSAGAVVMSTANYQRAWASSAPTAVQVQLKPGTSVSAAASAITRALGPGAGVAVLTSKSRVANTVSVGREGLSQLANIGALLVIAAILAMAAALTSALWQRRPSLAGLRLSGVRPARLRRILLLEAALMVGTGCLIGVIAGIYGQLIIDGYLTHVTGFPVASAFGSPYAAEVFGVVIGAALLIGLVPIWLVSNVSPGVALQDE
jgi:putative ABC transport system permease protein